MDKDLLIFNIAEACKRAKIAPTRAFAEAGISMASLGHFVGVPEAEMQVLGGWKSAQTMRKIYTHVEQKGLLRAQNAMAAFYASPAADAVSDSDTNANKLPHQVTKTAYPLKIGGFSFVSVHWWFLSGSKR